MEEKGASLYLIRNYLYYSRYSGGLAGNQAGRPVGITERRLLNILELDGLDLVELL